MVNIVKSGNNLPGKINENLPVKGSFYNVSGKKVPDSYRVQQEANDRRISTEIIFKEQTDTYAEAVVRAFHPDGWYCDAAVHHNFKAVQEMKFIDILGNFEKRKKYLNNANEPFIKNENGEPIPNLSEKGFILLTKEMMRFKNFSLRDAVTKAMRIAQLKIMNYEYRSKSEIQSEQTERNVVEQEKKEEIKQPRADKKIKTGEKEVKTELNESILIDMDADSIVRTLINTKEKSGGEVTPNAIKKDLVSLIRNKKITNKQYKEAFEYLINLNLKETTKQDTI